MYGPQYYLYPKREDIRLRPVMEACDGCGKVMWTAVQTDRFYQKERLERKGVNWVTGPSPKTFANILSAIIACHLRLRNQPCASQAVAAKLCDLSSGQVREARLYTRSGPSWAIPTLSRATPPMRHLSAQPRTRASFCRHSRTARPTHCPRPLSRQTKAEQKIIFLWLKWVNTFAAAPKEDFSLQQLGFRKN